MIQGPPGTGKTHTAVQLLRTLVKMGRGPICATADSTVAAHNLLDGFLAYAVNAIRIGRPVTLIADVTEAYLVAVVKTIPD